MKRPSQLQPSSGSLLNNPQRRSSSAIGNPSAAAAAPEGLPLLKLNEGSQQQLQQGVPRPVFGRNKQGIQREEITQKVISDRFKTYTFDKQFEYIKLDTRILHSILLGENQEFQDCVFLINQFNEEVENVKKQRHEFKHGPWKLRFYSHLYTLLKEIIFTRDRVVQRLFVKEVHKWVTQQLEALESEQQQIKAFEGDPAFMLSFLLNESNIGGVPPLPGQRRSSSAQGGRPRIKSIDNNNNASMMQNKSKVTFAQQQNNFLDESSILLPTKNNNTLLDESTRDATKLDVSQNEASFKVSSILTSAGLRPRMKQPSEYIAEALRDYKSYARTNHPEYEPPSIRLKGYKRRVLSFDDPSKFMRKVQTEPAEEISEFAGVTYPKPFTFEDMKRQKEEEIALALAEDVARQAAEAAALGLPPPGSVAPAAGTTPAEGESQQPGANGDATGTPAIQEGEDEAAAAAVKDANLVQIVEEKEEPPKAILQPNVKNFTQDKQGKDKYLRNLNNKFDARSDFIVYEPTEETPEMRMERQWMEGRQKEVKEKRENEEMLKLTKEWSLAKGRIEKEINRKIDSNIYGSRFKDCEYRFAKRSQEEMRKVDRETKEAARKQSALQDLLDAEENQRRVEEKQRDREERRREREQNWIKKKKMKGIYDSDSDKENNDRDNESYDEELDGPFDPKDPKFAKHKKLHAQFASVVRKEHKSIDLTGNLPKLAKSQFVDELFPYRGVENDARKQKIEMIKKLHGGLIGLNCKTEEAVGSSSADANNLADEVDSQHSQSQAGLGLRVKTLESEPISKQRSLSVYSRDVMQKMRPFSAVFDHANLLSIQNEQIAEMHEVKKRFIKYQLAVPYKQLREAILIPDILTDQADLELLPEPGYGLVKNPFMKDKKKKKKKKKRS